MRIDRMKSLIPWDQKPAIVTTTTFKRIKHHVLWLKEAETKTRVIVSPEELRQQLEATDPTWQFNEAEMLTCLGHLENYGYVRAAPRRPKGRAPILLAPELLNNLAASFVLDAGECQGPGRAGGAAIARGGLRSSPSC